MANTTTAAAQEEEEKPKSLWTRYVIWLVVPIILALYFSQENTVLADAKTRQVLPTDVIPTHYNIELTPDIENFVFNGTVQVDLNVNSKTSNIVLNANELDIDVAKVLYDDVSYVATGIQYDNKTNQVSLAFDKTFPKNSKITLEVIFKGTLNTHMSGFYRSSYKNADGETKYLATSQFEATDARKAFPCWDEPSLKATFNITLNVPKDLTALSNMEIISESPVSWSPDLKTVKYATTPRMSTYLVAFVVGPFEYIEAHTTSGIRTRVYTLPGVSHQGTLALDVAAKALEYFGQVFGIAYPLSKLDMVAIPDFDAVAMENWGLVTFRTQGLLYDEQKSAFATKRQIAYVVCHELAHQWFGNLVTMEWWDHLWLNEGFATWVGWFAIDHIYPEWRTWSMFATQTFQDALDLDGLLSTHAIHVPVYNPSEIHQIFDSVSYLKGASAIRMATSWLTTQTFLQGIHRYLSTHKYRNAATENLWSALTVESGKNVSEFMDAWVQRPGFPVLNVSLVDEETIRVTQSRFFLSGEEEEEEENSSTVWWIPLQLKHTSGTEDYTLKTKTQNFTIPVNATFKLNHGQTSLYRVNYSKEILDTLLQQLRLPGYGVLSDPIDRAGLISDLGTLSQSGVQSTFTFLDFVQHLSSEKNYFVLTELSRKLNNVIALYEYIPSVNEKLQRLRQNIFSPIANNLGWRTMGTSEPELYNLLRVLVITESGLSGQKNVVASALARYKQFMEQNKTDAIMPDLMSTVYKIALKNAKTEEEENQVWDDIFTRVYHNESLPMDQRINALKSIGSTIKFDKVINKNLELILDTEQVRSQDVSSVFISLSSNQYAKYQLVNFFMDHYDDIYKRLGKTIGMTSAMGPMISTLSNSTVIEKLEDFFATKDTVEYSRVLNGALEKAKVNAAQLEREKEQFIVWAEK